MQGCFLSRVLPNELPTPSELEVELYNFGHGKTALPRREGFRAKMFIRETPNKIVHDVYSQQ